jgi:predicted Zn-dependent protease
MHRVRRLAVAGAIGLSACATVPGTGYDPMGIARVIGRLEHFLEVTTRRKHVPTWFDDHPSTPEGVASLTQRAASGHGDRIR